MWKFWIILLVPIWLTAGVINYSVYFIGIDDREVLKNLKASSDLTTLKNRPPSSVNTLKFRAESDIPQLLKVLHAHGYYDATVTTRVDDFDGKATVYVMIQPGPVYTIDHFQITLEPDTCAALTMEAIGIEIGMPAIAGHILEAEQKILNILADHAHPLAVIEKRDMKADGKTKTISIDLMIHSGPEVRFGSSEYLGLRRVKPELLKKKTAWQEGDLYESALVEKTQKSLLDTGVFSSVLITRASANTLAPMKIEVTESKHRSINIGASYQTFFGPGLTFGWENRNVGGMGRRLTLQGDITKKAQSGIATFFVPDLFRLNQDFVTHAQAMYESIYPYDQKSYSLTGRVERRIGTAYRVSLGMKLDHVIVSKSVDNGTFTVLEGPLYFRWSSASDLLNPIRGATLEYRLVPSLNFTKPAQFYIYQAITYAFYWPLVKSGKFVIAQQIIVEDIWSQHLDATPVPKRILGGTEQELRGYRYRSVSPLDGRRPIGGRFGTFYTFEARWRMSKTIGLVPFFDIGNVHLNYIPTLDGKWFKSAGLGIRYFTFLGPLRVDIAFPLDRRHGIDPLYRFLVSIGQTF
jgi:translocation and assembly module TamA